MPKTILKDTESDLVVHIVNEDTETITLLEGGNPAGYAIKEVFWSISGNGAHHIEISRNSIPVLDLANGGTLKVNGYALDIESDQTINVDLSSGGSGTHYTLILHLKKIRA